MMTPYHAFDRARFAEIWRYAQGGLVNAAFGFALFSVLVWAGLNLFLAQMLSTLISVIFNYTVYKKHVFRDALPAKMKFIGSYISNYLVSLMTLAAAATIFPSPYLCGVISIVTAAIINYFLLRYLVFTRAPDNA